MEIKMQTDLEHVMVIISIFKYDCQFSVHQLDLFHRQLKVICK